MSRADSISYGVLALVRECSFRPGVVTTVISPEVLLYTLPILYSFLLQLPNLIMPFFVVVVSVVKIQIYQQRKLLIRFSVS